MVDRLRPNNWDRLTVHSFRNGELKVQYDIDRSIAVSSTRSGVQPTTRGLKLHLAIGRLSLSSRALHRERA